MILKDFAGCRKLIPYGSAGCPKCEEKHRMKAEVKARENKRESDRRNNKKRPKEERSFYNSKEWKK